MCGGISGTIGALDVDPDYQDEEVDIPIDALVVNLLARIDDDEDDLGAQPKLSSQKTQNFWGSISRNFLVHV